jgi:hypothetical protein
MHRLARLRETRGKEYGKLVQKLLALSFLEAGASRVTERSIQGIDLEVEVDGRRLALEVKTTETGNVKLGTKDVKGLDARMSEGYETYVAVLGVGLLDEWVFAAYRGGEPAQGVAYSPHALRPYRTHDLEARITALFDDLLARHLAGAVERGQGYLDEVLGGYSAFAQA